MAKNPAMTYFLEDVTKQLFGRSRAQSLKSAICPCCGKPASQYRDDLSRREAEISGMCQACQDSVFGEG
jgi:hypothetical protein